MMRWSSFVLAGVLLVPAAAEAQKPSNNMHTRSADVYLSQALASGTNPGDRLDAFAKAAEAARAGTQSDPNNSKPWFQLGISLAGLGKFVAADSAFDRAEAMYPEYSEEIDPERLRAWITSYNASVAALQKNDVAAAIQALETANVMYQKRPEALVTLGSLYVQENELDKADKAFRDALLIIRGPAAADLNAETKAQWLEDELSVSMRLANILNQRERFADAEAVYRDLLRSQPANTLAKANLAATLIRAGKADEAGAVYRELLAMEDLTETTLFNVGIGLFRAQEWEDAATAFRRSIQLNAHSHESLYNLSQSLLAQVGELETQMETATDKAALQQKVTSIYTEMLELTQRLRAIDPTNRNVFMMQAQAERSLGEAAAGAQAAEWRNKVLATLEAHKALPFEVTNLSVQMGEEAVQVSGSFHNLTAPQGSELKIRFVIVDSAGSELASEQIAVQAPATEENERFMKSIPTPEGAAGWRYEVIN